MDFDIAVLNGDLQEEVFMEQPEGFVKQGEETKVALLKKSLYGLKQAPREWNRKLHKSVIAAGYQQSKCDNALYFLRNSETSMIVYREIYVDDLVFTGNDKDGIQCIKASLRKDFTPKDLGELSRIIGLEISINGNEKTT